MEKPEEKAKKEFIISMLELLQVEAVRYQYFDTAAEIRELVKRMKHDAAVDELINNREN